VSEIREHARSQLRKAQSGQPLSSVAAEYVPILVSAAPTSEAEARWRNAFWFGTAARRAAHKKNANLAYLYVTAGMNEYQRGSNALFGGSSNPETIRQIVEGGTNFLRSRGDDDVVSAMLPGATSAAIQAQQGAGVLPTAPLKDAAKLGAKVVQTKKSPFAPLILGLGLMLLIGMREAQREV
jgi:hypothetical protein